MPNHEIILGVTGGIAAYKSAALCSLAVQSGCDVTVVMTDAATRFVGPATFAALTGRAVRRHVFDTDGPGASHPLGAHIELAREASLLCVAPASASFLAKAAHGLADDLLSTLYLSFTGKVLIAPAMNTEMWNKPVVQRNVAQLQADGADIIGPDSGWLSCRDTGAGRMSSPEAIWERIQATLAS
ncbi:MAG: phosphopantothenoylcysteine decarboxylase [Pirellulales bacterium]|nr:phosphopantothenoylcysteine decarboxylase [Pirellulales bacterium]